MTALRVRRRFRRIRFNPVELGVFLVVVSIFGNSAYQLFVEQPSTVTRGLASLSQGRFAQAGGLHGNIEVGCDREVRQTTHSPKVRIHGPLCGVVQPKESSDTAATVVIESIQVQNKTNQVQAVVFPDLSGKTFLTDYLPLTQGDNHVTVETSYRVGSARKVFQQTLIIKQAKN